MFYQVKNFRAYLSIEYVVQSKFPGLSRTCIKIQGLSRPGKWFLEIQGLSRISRTCTNPVLLSRHGSCWKPLNQSTWRKTLYKTMVDMKYNKSFLQAVDFLEMFTINTNQGVWHNYNQHWPYVWSIHANLTVSCLCPALESTHIFRIVIQIKPNLFCSCLLLWLDLSLLYCQPISILSLMQKIYVSRFWCINSGFIRRLEWGSPQEDIFRFILWNIRWNCRDCNTRIVTLSKFHLFKYWLSCSNFHAPRHFIRTKYERLQSYFNASRLSEKHYETIADVQLCEKLKHFVNCCP